MIPSPRIAEVQQAVAAYYSLSETDLSSTRRTHGVVYPRQLAMFLARALTSRTLPEIGRMFGGRDHSTVHHAIQAVETRLALDVELNNTVRVLAADVARLVAARPVVEVAG